METRRLSHEAWKSVQRFDLGAGSRKKDRTVKKSQRRYISPIWGEAPTEPIITKICTVVAVPDVITCANFWAEIFRGYDFTGVEILVFLLILSWALQQCSATALPVTSLYICWHKMNVIKQRVTHRPFVLPAYNQTISTVGELIALMVSSLATNGWSV